jgi:flagellar biosynthetic protein FliO
MDGIADINFFSIGIRTLSMLLVVLAFLLITLYLFKWFSNTRGNNKGGICIKPLSSVSLSPKNKLQVVEIEGEKIVVGVSPGSINFIAKINSAANEKSEFPAGEIENNA